MHTHMTFHQPLSALCELKPVDPKVLSFQFHRIIIQVEAVDSETFESMKRIPSRKWMGSIGKVSVKFHRTCKAEGT